MVALKIVIVSWKACPESNGQAKREKVVMVILPQVVCTQYCARFTDFKLTPHRQPGLLHGCSNHEEFEKSLGTGRGDEGCK